MINDDTTVQTSSASLVVNTLDPCEKSATATSHSLSASASSRAPDEGNDTVNHVVGQPFVEDTSVVDEGAAMSSSKKAQTTVPSASSGECSPSALNANGDEVLAAATAEAMGEDDEDDYTLRYSEAAELAEASIPRVQLHSIQHSSASFATHSAVARCIAGFLPSLDLALAFCCLHEVSSRAADSELRSRVRARRVHREHMAVPQQLCGNLYVGSISLAASASDSSQWLEVISLYLSDGIQVTYCPRVRSTFFMVADFTDALDDGIIPESLALNASSVGAGEAKVRGLVFGVLSGPLCRELITLPHRRRSEKSLYNNTIVPLSDEAVNRSQREARDNAVPFRTHFDCSAAPGGSSSAVQREADDASLMASLPKRFEHAQSHITSISGWWHPMDPHFLLSKLFAERRHGGNSGLVSRQHSAPSTARRPAFPPSSVTAINKQSIRKQIIELKYARPFFPLAHDVTAQFLRGAVSLRIHAITRSSFDGSYALRLPTEPSPALLSKCDADALVCRISLQRSAASVAGSTPVMSVTYELAPIPRVLDCEQDAEYLETPDELPSVSSVVEIGGSMLAIPHAHLIKPLPSVERISALVPRPFAVASNHAVLPPTALPPVRLAVFLDGVHQPIGFVDDVPLQMAVPDFKNILRAAITWFPSWDLVSLKVYRNRPQSSGTPPASGINNPQGYSTPSSLNLQPASRRASARSNRPSSNSISPDVGDGEGNIVVDLLPPVNGQFLQRTIEGYDSSVYGWSCPVVHALYDCMLCVVLVSRDSAAFLGNGMELSSAASARVRNLRAAKARENLKDVHPAVQMYFVAQGAALDACRRGDVQLLSQLLSGSGAIGGHSSGAGTLSVGVAVKHGLLSSRLPTDLTPVSPQDGSSVLLMHVAAENGRKAILELLIEKGFPVDQRDSDGQFPLHKCAKRGHAECIPVILRAPNGACTLDAPDNQGKTALHLSLENRFVNTALWLIEQGANPDVRDPAGRSPCDYASVALPDLTTMARGGNAEGVRAMLQGALPFDAVQSLHTTESAASQWYMESLKHRLTKGRLLYGLRGQFQIHSRTGITIPNVLGLNALHEAVIAGNLQVVKALLAKPGVDLIDLYEANAAGDTALHLAAKSPVASMFPFVLAAYEYGSEGPMAALTMTNARGETPLHIALRAAKRPECTLHAVHILTRCQACPAKYLLTDFGYLVLHIADTAGFTACHHAVLSAPYLPEGVLQALLAAALSAGSALSESVQPHTPSAPTLTLADRFTRTFPAREASPRRAQTCQPTASLFSLAVSTGNIATLQLITEFMCHCVQQDIPWPLAEFGSLASRGLLSIAFLRDNIKMFRALMALQAKYDDRRLRPFTELDLLTSVNRMSEDGSTVEVVEVPLAWEVLHAGSSAQWIDEVMQAQVMVSSIRRADLGTYELSAAMGDADGEPGVSTISGLVDEIVHARDQAQRKRLPSRPDPAPPILTTWGQFLVKPTEPTVEECQSKWSSEMKLSDHRLHWAEKETLLLYALRRVIMTINPAALPNPTHIERVLYNRRVLYAAARCRGHNPAFSILMSQFEGTHVFSHTSLLRCLNVGVQYGLLPTAGVQFQNLRPDGRMFTPSSSQKQTREQSTGGASSMRTMSRERNALLSRGSLQRGAKKGGSGSNDGDAVEVVVSNSFLPQEHPAEVKVREREAQLCQLLPYVAVQHPGALLHDLCSRRLFHAAMTLLVTATANAHQAHHSRSPVRSRPADGPSTDNEGGQRGVAPKLRSENVDLRSAELETMAGVSALHIASQFGVSQLVMALLKTGQFRPREASSARNWTPMHWAARYGHVDTCRALLSLGVPPIDISDPTNTGSCLGTTPLHLAAVGGSVELVRLFVEYNALVDSRSLMGRTPLHLACKKNRADVALVLLDAGARVDREDEDGNTPLLLAAQEGHGDLCLRVVQSAKRDNLLLTVNRLSGVSLAHYAAWIGGPSMNGLLLRVCQASHAAARTGDGAATAERQTSAGARATPGKRDVITVSRPTSRAVPVGFSVSTRPLSGFAPPSLQQFISGDVDCLDSPSWIEQNQSFIARPQTHHLGESRGAAFEMIATSPMRTPFLERFLKTELSPETFGAVAPSRPQTADDFSQYSLSSSAAHDPPPQRMFGLAPTTVASKFGASILLDSMNGRPTRGGDIPRRRQPPSDSVIAVTPPPGGALDVLQALVDATEDRRQAMLDGELHRSINKAATIAKSAANANLQLPDSFTRISKGIVCTDTPIMLCEDKRGAHPLLPVHYALANGQKDSARILRENTVTQTNTFGKVPDIPLDCTVATTAAPTTASAAASSDGSSLSSPRNKRVLLGLHPNVLDREEMFPTIAGGLSVPAAIIASVEALRELVFAPLPPPPPPPRIWHVGYYGCGEKGVVGAILRAANTTMFDCSTVFKLSKSRVLSSLAWMVGHRLCSELFRYFALLNSVDEPVDSSTNITLLMIAAMMNHVDVAEVLIDFGADVNAVAQLRVKGGGCGITPILIASAAGCLAMVEKLIEHGADVDVSDECGNTPVHHAVLHKNFRMLKVLLHAGASIDVCNNAGDSPEDIAVALRTHNIVRLLRWWSMTFHIELTDLKPKRQLCRTEVDYAEWIAETKTFYKRLDLLHEDSKQLLNKEEKDSVPALMYLRLCQRLKVSPSRCVVNQLIPFWWPEEIHTLKLQGVFLEDNVLQALFTFVKLLTHLEDLELSDCKLTNEIVPDLCTATIEHPHLRRLHLMGNRGIGRAGALKLLDLVTRNTNIVGIDLTATSVEPPMSAPILRQVDLNKKRQSLETQDPTKPVNVSPPSPKTYHLPRVDSPIEPGCDSDPYLPIMQAAEEYASLSILNGTFGASAARSSKRGQGSTSNSAQRAASRNGKDRSE